ncbi:cupin domain-containing protein [Opitutaceae bacterium]|nr:cupin domain-containing protein [Opitutaceae bacterium]
MITKVNLAEKFAKLDEHWSPRVVGSVDGTHLAKIAKLKGTFTWHKHDHEDELFLVIKGQLVIELEDQKLTLDSGEMVVIPAGVMHNPIADEECHVLVFEQSSTAHTGSKTLATTKSLDDQLRPI